MFSSIYEGEVEHCRFRPVEHRFRYRIFMLMLDLDELPELNRRGILRSRGTFAPVKFLPSDYLEGDNATTGQTLREQVSQIVRAQTGSGVQGPVRMLCQLRYWGYYFSPLNLYYCYAADGTTLETIVAEVNNIPWRERHTYVLWSGNRDSQTENAIGQHQHAKQFHVSPFMPMNQQYRWNVTAPSESLSIQLENWDQASGPFTAIPLSQHVSTSGFSRAFTAKMRLQRRELTWSRLQTNAIRHGWMSGKVVAAIYYEAFKLWLKKSPYYPHPTALISPESATP